MIKSLNFNPKFLACLTTLSNRAEEIIVPRLVQSNSGVPSEVCVDSIFDSAIIIVIFVYLNNGAHPRVVVENCNFLSTLLICNIKYYILQCRSYYAGIQRSQVRDLTIKIHLRIL